MGAEAGERGMERNDMRRDDPGARIKLEHGSGGALSRELVDGLIFPRFRGESYPELSDGARVSIDGEAVLTTDTYVVDPLFFPGGDIGTLGVYGTCNDLSVSGAVPRYLTLGLVLEEGVPIRDLERVLASVAAASAEADVRVVSGDTKVVPRGKGGGIFLNTSGVGARIFAPALTPGRIRSGDAVIVSAPVGSHGITILAARESLSVGGNLKSDCACLHPLCSLLFGLGEDLRFMRDATRGGLAAVLNEAAQGRSWILEVDEAAVPIDRDVAAVAEILGLNPLEVANEGVLVAVVADGRREEALALLRSHPLGAQASVIGRVMDAPDTDRGRVILRTFVGGRRILDFPRGLVLPRIC